MSIQTLSAGQTWGTTRSKINANMSGLDAKFDTDLTSFQLNSDGIDRSCDHIVKGATSGNVDLTAYGIVAIDSSDRPVTLFNNTGRMDLIDYSGQGGVASLFNLSSPTNYMTVGHYGYGCKNSDGNLNTVSYLMSYVTDTTSSAMSSDLQFGIMVDQDTTGGYSQPNSFMIFNEFGLTVPGGAVIDGDVRCKDSILLQNKAETAWLNFALRYTAGTEAGYILQNVVSLDASNYVAVGIPVAEACVHIKAGTTGIAPLKMTPGAVLTTPQKGTIEYVDDGTDGHFYMTMMVDGVVTRREISFI